MVLQLKLYPLSIIITAIFNRGEKKKKKIEGYKPRRWVAERGIAWLKGNRSVRTRYCQKLENYQSCIHCLLNYLDETCYKYLDETCYKGHTT